MTHSPPYDRAAEDRAAAMVTERAVRMVNNLAGQGSSQFALVTGLSRALAHAVAMTEPSIGGDRLEAICLLIANMVKASTRSLTGDRGTLQ